MMTQASVLVLALLSSSVSALALNNVPAIATKPGILIDVAIPIPTPAPENKDLRRRQEAQRTLLAGPDATCGFIGGNATQPWGCTASSTCAFATATVVAVNSTQTTAPGSVLCCGSAGCPTVPGPTSCVDKGRFDIKTACTGSCLEDEKVLKCTSGIYLFCNTIAFASPSISAFFCNYISTYSPLAAETTFSGQGGRIFTTTIQTLPASMTSATSSTIASSTGTSSSSTLAPKTSAPVTSASAAAASDDGEKKKTNKGAIIGGTIGGVVGLALIAAAIFFFLRWRKLKRELGPVIGDEHADAGEVKGASPASASEEAVAKPVKTESKVEGKKVVV